MIWDLNPDFQINPDLDVHRICPKILSFRQVWYKSVVDCTRNANRCPKNLLFRKWWRKWKIDLESTRRSKSPPKVNHFQTLEDKMFYCFSFRVQNRIPCVDNSISKVKFMKSYLGLLLGWPLSRQCEIRWRFVALLRGTRHVKCYSYHARTSVTVSGEEVGM